MDEIFHLRENSAGNKILNGFFRGEVEYNLDPLSSGRCKVRIYALHGDHTRLGTSDLPWAYPVMQWTGADHGSFRVPAVGERVVVGFEMGHKDNPMYFGSWVSIPPEPRSFSSIVDQHGNSVPAEDLTITSRDWKSNPGLETPRESQVGVNRDLQRKVTKSAKGHTILMDDRDGGESFSLIDRAGQGLFFESAVTEEGNEANATQRGIDSALNGKPLDSHNEDDEDILVGRSSRVVLSDAATQSVQLNSREGQENVRLKSTTFASQSDHQILDISAGLGRATWDLVKGNKVVGRLIYEGQSGNFVLESEFSITLRAKTINLAGQQVNVSGTLVADKVLST